MEKDNGIACPNGYVYDKQVNVRYLDEKKTDGFSTTADGDAGGSGIIDPVKNPPANNRCFSQKGAHPADERFGQLGHYRPDVRYETNQLA